MASRGCSLVAVLSFSPQWPLLRSMAHGPSAAAAPGPYGTGSAAAAAGPYGTGLAAAAAGPYGTGSVAAAHGRSWHVRSSWIRDQTHVSCVGSWILNH